MNRTDSSPYDPPRAEPSSPSHFLAPRNPMAPTRMRVAAGLLALLPVFAMVAAMASVSRHGWPASPLRWLQFVTLFSMCIFSIASLLAIACGAFRSRGVYIAFTFSAVVAGVSIFVPSILASHGFSQ